MRAGSWIATAFAGVATAATLSNIQLLQANEKKLTYHWEVTGWSAGCAQSDCSYDFNITAQANTTAYPQQPAFHANCHGSGEGAPYEICDLLEDPETELRVEAKLLESKRIANQSTGANIQVSLKHVDLESPMTYWNYTAKGEASYNAEGPSENFTITPHEVFGAA